MNDQHLRARAWYRVYDHNGLKGYVYPLGYMTRTVHGLEKRYLLSLYFYKYAGEWRHRIDEEYVDPIQETDDKDSPVLEELEQYADDYLKRNPLKDGEWLEK